MAAAARFSDFRSRKDRTALSLATLPTSRLRLGLMLALSLSLLVLGAVVVAAAAEGVEDEDKDVKEWQLAGLLREVFL
jgi:hypothetical protein